MRSMGRLRDWPASVRRPVASPDDLAEPIVAELFSVERLEQHAASLAAAQAITGDPRRGHDLRPRVSQNGRVLLASYGALARAIQEEQSITPAADWLVDRFSRLAPAMPVTASVDPGGGQFLIALTTARRR